MGFMVIEKCDPVGSNPSLPPEIEEVTNGTTHRNRVFSSIFHPPPRLSGIF